MKTIWFGTCPTCGHGCTFVQYQGSDRVCHCDNCDAKIRVDEIRQEMLDRIREMNDG